MKQVTDHAVVVSRRDYGEADKLVVFLTKRSGKLTGMVKGARKSGSKMSGGIELFSVSSITFLESNRDIKTVISTRLEQHYGSIVKHIDKTMWAYEGLKLLDKSTESECDESFYNLAVTMLASLNDEQIHLTVTRVWFYEQLLSELGHTINTQTDVSGNPLELTEQYDFSFESMSFIPSERGGFTAQHIKLLRLVQANPPEKLMQIRGAIDLCKDLIGITESSIKLFIR